MEKKGGEGEHSKARHNEQFKEHRYKKWGSRRNNYQQEKVRNKVGVIIENKFDALEEKKETTDEKGHQGEEKDKMIDENKVEKKRDINQSASSSSGQKDRQTESQSSTAGKGKNPIEISSEEKETVVEGTPNSTRSTNQKGNNISKEKAVRKNKEEDMQDKDESLKKAPDLMEEREDQIQEKRELEKDENMEYNIQQISKAGDLSPRHTDSLKNGTKRGKLTIPFQVQTRSNKVKITKSDQ
uniref:Syne-1B n=1 Tax=Solanum tuberosum TaxID=4113 RepID=M1DQP4_SOLTU